MRIARPKPTAALSLSNTAVIKFRRATSSPPLPSPPNLTQPDLHPSNTFLQQIPITASLFFASHSALWLIKIRYAGDVAAAARWDDPPDENDGCPHLYGRGFGPADVEGVKRFSRDAGVAGGGGGGDWKEVFAASGWLE